MVKQRLFLGSVAFGISFGISFLTSRNLGTAIASGATTTVAAVAASVVVDRQHDRRAQIRIADLKNHIQALQQRRAEAYQAYVQLETEKEQLAASLNTLALQPSQPNVMPSSQKRLPASAKALSWNLATPGVPDQATGARPNVKPYELPTEIPAAASPAPSGSDWGRSNTEISPQLLSDAAATKHKIETSLIALQAELRQIKGHITDHRQTREKLSREVADNREEKRQLDATVKTLKREVQALETGRVELEQFLADAEAKKQALETGSNPLQVALQALQAQVEVLQEELRVLEAQILDRRSQKETLEQQLAVSTIPAAIPLPSLVQPEPNSKNGSAQNGSSDGIAVVPAKKAIAAQSTPAKRPVAIAKPARPLKSSSTPLSAIVVLPSIAADKSEDELPHEWTEFMVQLPEYELQVLKVIVEQKHPAAALKQIAEANLTMPELLIDSINEQALDTIGDLLLDANAGAGSATIARDHLETVKMLLQTYEYLVN